MRLCSAAFTLSMLFLACFAALFSGMARADGAEVEKPNIIFIMADDLGCDWMGCYGSTHKTPNIDRLASQGVRFTTAWCNPICTPTRLTLLTGLYPLRTGWIDHHDVPRWGGIGFDWNRYTSFARVVQQSGYATAIAGKWQVTDFRQYPDALKLHGFDEHCVWTGYESGNPPSYERYWSGYFQTNGDRRTHENRFGPDVVNDFVLDFIERKKDGPFLAYYPMMLPHGPTVPTPFNKDNPPEDKSQLYAGMVTYVDYLVGKVVKKVDDLGLADRTVIIYTGDNGSSMGGNRYGNKYPGGKGKIVDWGAHVPLIVRAPWMTEGGRVTDDLVDFSDMLPTFADLAGAPLPAGVPLDGRSFVGSIDGTAADADKRTWIYSQRAQMRAVRDVRFKADQSGAFWDLKNDPLEQHDLRHSTDSEIAAARKRLSGVLASFPEDAPPPFPEFRPGQKKAAAGQ